MTEAGFRDTTVEQVVAEVATKQVGAREQVARALAAIDRLDGTIHAFVAIDAERALAEADEVDRRIAAGEDVGPLAGVPLAVKDIEDATGFTTSQGSALHAGDAPAQRDSEHVARLRAAGCIVVGKTNTPEFGWQADTSNEVFPSTRNPWNPERSAGGSSGGSAAAIAAGMVPLATGSDGGGSIRIPSAVHGLTGLKTSLGRVPGGGPTPARWMHLSCKGPMARTARRRAGPRRRHRLRAHRPARAAPAPRPVVALAGRRGPPAPPGRVVARTGLRHGRRRDRRGLPRRRRSARR